MLTAYTFPPASPSLSFFVFPLYTYAPLHCIFSSVKDKVSGLQKISLLLTVSDVLIVSQEGIKPVIPNNILILINCKITKFWLVALQKATCIS